MAWRRCACCLLLGAGAHLALGDCGVAFDATDCAAFVERKHGWDRVHHQLTALAVCEHSSAAGRLATAAMAAPRASRAGVVLRAIPRDVVVGSSLAIVSCKGAKTESRTAEKY